MRKLTFLIFFFVNSLIINAQKKGIGKFGAAYIAMDAEAFYFGPALALGVTKDVKHTRFGIGVHGFVSYVHSEAENYTGRLKMLSGNVFAQRYLFKNRLKNLYGSIGLTYQFRRENFRSNYLTIVNDIRYAFMGNYALGYTLNKKTAAIQYNIELFGTGPYVENDIYGQYMEVLTQLGLGLKVSF